MYFQNQRGNPNWLHPQTQRQQCWYLYAPEPPSSTAKKCTHNRSYFMFSVWFHLYIPYPSSPHFFSQHTPPPLVYKATQRPLIKRIPSLTHLRWPSTDGFLVPVPACAEICLFGPNYLLEGTHIGPVENVRFTIKHKREEKRAEIQYWKMLYSWSSQFESHVKLGALIVWHSWHIACKSNQNGKKKKKPGVIYLILVCRFSEIYFFSDIKKMFADITFYLLLWKKK